MSTVSGIQGYRSARSSLIETVIVVGLFAAGLGLLTSQIPAAVPREIPTLVGLVLVVVSLVYVYRTRLGRRAETFRTDAFFVWHGETNELADVKDYEFSEEMGRYLRAAMLEQEALRRQWIDEPLWNRSMPIDGVFVMPGRTRSGRLVVECVEYMLINRLTLHLGSYFTGAEFSDEKLVEYKRDDVADVIQGNRILELFSRPMEDRAAFRQAPRVEDPDIASTIVSSHQGGRLFNRFEIRLPKGSRMYRRNREIVIEGPVFSLILKVDFDGFNTVLPRDFDSLYLKGSMLDLQAFRVGIAVDTVIKRRAAFRRQDWAYFGWPDSFFAYLEREWSAEAFFDAIGWPSIRAFAHTMGPNATAGAGTPTPHRAAAGSRSRRIDIRKSEVAGSASGQPAKPPASSKKGSQ